MPIKRREGFQFGEPSMMATPGGPQRRTDDDGMSPNAPMNGSAMNGQQPPTDWMAMLMKMLGGK